MIAHRVFCMSVVCSTVVIAPANTGPMNFLKVMVGDKKSNSSRTAYSKSSKAAAVFMATTATAVLPSGHVDASVATGVVPKRLPAADGNADNGNRASSDDLKHDENNNNVANNAVFQRLCSAVLYAATMPQHSSDVADVTAGSVGMWSPSVATAAVNVASSTERRHHYARKSFRKRFPPAGYGSVPHEWFAVSTRPADRYRDPILAQETSRGVDYLTSYPLSKDTAEEDEKYYEDVDRPAEVWKIKVVGEPMSKSSRDDATAVADDEDDEDDDMAASE